MSDLRTFHEAVKKGDQGVVSTALAEDPSLLNSINEASQSAFLLAKYYRQEAMAAYLLSCGAELTFFDECAAGQTEHVMARIQAQPDLLESYSSDGWTPLHLAAFFGSKDLAEALLNAGANVDTRSTNSMQNTALHAAVAGRRLTAAKLLLERGADADARQAGGWSALHGAAQNGDREMVEALLAHGAQIDARAENNQCALDLALLRGHQEIADLLEGLGAKL